jgi:hypothetical protein
LYALVSNFPATDFEGELIELNPAIDSFLRRSAGHNRPALSILTTVNILAICRRLAGVNL